MAENHWIDKRLACNSPAVFNALDVEVKRVVNAWNSAEGNDPNVVKVVRERDADRFERIKVYLGTVQRAHLGHIPEESCITGSRTVMDQMGNVTDRGDVAVTVRWDPARDKCVIAAANGEETVESLVRWMLEPLLFAEGR